MGSDWKKNEMETTISDIACDYDNKNKMKNVMNNMKNDRKQSQQGFERIEWIKQKLNGND